MNLTFGIPCRCAGPVLPLFVPDPLLPGNDLAPFVEILFCLDSPVELSLCLLLPFVIPFPWHLSFCFPVLSRRSLRVLAIFLHFSCSPLFVSVLLIVLSLASY